MRIQKMTLPGRAESILTSLSKQTAHSELSPLAVTDTCLSRRAAEVEEASAGGADGATSWTGTRGSAT